MEGGGAPALPHFTRFDFIRFVLLFLSVQYQPLILDKVDIINIMVEHG